MLRKSLFTLSLSAMSLGIFADDQVTCEKKNNYLSRLYPTFYSSIEITIEQTMNFGTEEAPMYFNKGDKLDVVNANIAGDDTITFDLIYIDSESKEYKTALRFTKKDIYEATVMDLEEEGMLSVSCVAIPIEDHTSQLGRHDAEFRLLKPIDDIQ